jgi:hypothetical protein
MQIYYFRSFTEIWPPGTFCWGRTKLLKLPTLVYLVISMNRERIQSRLGYVKYHTIPYHTIPYHTIPYHTIPYHTIPYHTIQQTCSRLVTMLFQQLVFALLVLSLLTSCQRRHSTICQQVVSGNLVTN